MFQSLHKKILKIVYVMNLTEASDDIKIKNCYCCNFKK